MEGGGGGGGGGGGNAYLTVFGLAEYFKRSSLDTIKGDYILCTF